MSDAHNDPARLSLGAYALGTLEPADQESVEAHLAGCPACLAELADLQAALPALATLTPADVAPPPLPDTLFARIVDAIDTEPAPKAHRSRRWLVAVAASIVLLAGAGTAVGIALSSSHGGSTVASASAGGVSLRVAATDDKAGTRLELTAMGLRERERCHLVAQAADGTRHDAGTWVATYSGAARVVETTDVPRSQLRRLTLYGTGGRQLLVVNTR